MTEKNICQNPKCCDSTTDDRWNKKIGRFQSRKAYRKSKPTNNTIYEYFCTTSCGYSWLEDKLENIILNKSHYFEQISQPEPQDIKTTLGMCQGTTACGSAHYQASCSSGESIIIVRFRHH